MHNKEMVRPVHVVAVLLVAARIGSIGYQLEVANAAPAPGLDAVVPWDIRLGAECSCPGARWPAAPWGLLVRSTQAHERNV